MGIPHKSLGIRLKKQSNFFLNKWFRSVETFIGRLWRYCVLSSITQISHFVLFSEFSRLTLCIINVWGWDCRLIIYCCYYFQVNRKRQRWSDINTLSEHRTLRQKLNNCRTASRECFDSTNSQRKWFEFDSTICSLKVTIIQHCQFC